MPRLSLFVVTLAFAFAAGGAALAEEPPPFEVDLMSFNIRFGTANDGPDHWRHRHEMVFDVIDRRGGDFVGLQEAVAFQIDAIREAVPRYATVGVGRDDGERRGEFTNILYDRDRWELDAEHHGTFWLSDTPEKVASTSWGNDITRICTWARFIERGTGRGIYIFNTHWDHRSQPSRVQSAKLVMQRIADRAHPGEPVVLMGDMNAGEDNPAMQYVRGEAADAPLKLVDTFRVVHPEAEEVGTFNGFTIGSTGGAKIDHVLVEPGAVVLEAAIDRTAREGQYPSDHFPVTAKVRWEN
ncbi:MAG: endonuclease/exonuclease/phosphatase family protein [Phycisphaeraceae bacterium]